MKKLSKKIILFTLFLFITCLVTFETGKASPATSYTMTLNSKGRWVRTQDAYLPDRTIIELKLKDPQDIFFDKNDIMYIADTGNKRILKYNPNNDEVLLVIENEAFKTPKGIFITEDDYLYIADTSAQLVFKYDTAGNFIEQYGTPDSQSFEGKTFNPAKIGVDKRGNMYIYGEGIYDGIIQLSKSGEFLGYFTSNRIELSFIERLQDRFFTEAQKAKLFPKTPTIFSNVYVDTNGFVYTTSMNSSNGAVKRHNIAGGNQFTNGVISPTDPVDVYVNKSGIIFVAMDSGSIFVYSRDGEYIYSFAASNFKDGVVPDDVSGLFTSISALAIDSTGKVWAVDDKKSFIQSFTATEYAEKVYEALELYNLGKYEEAVVVWEDVLRLNQMSVLAHNNIGKNYYSLQEYEKAMHHFEIAGNRWNYSESFWEVRNTVLQKYIGIAFIVLAALYLISLILKIMKVNHKVSAAIKEPFRRINKIKFINNLLYMFRVLIHPKDSYYELKKGHKGSLLGAFILLIAFFITYLWYVVGKDFIYQFIAVEDMDLNSIILGFFGLITLFVVCNYLVTSINDGEGGFKQIFIMFMYSLAPMFIAFTSVTLLSYVLTYNEAFILDVIMTVAYAWTGINILIGVQETHNYTMWETIKSIAITIAFMIIFLVMLIMVIVMWEQLYNFFEAIIREAIRNANN